ncbi:hypothetical protein MUK42_21158 [Musa troglodytarum]|uniref:Uncharacterized protein n=1 Tax=Musa troglodytarum TaxID=320322 RepID=A0A9E7L5Z2_9LILI|nr:hypothetical protein MUK42_21158 [Musa troglodytarum]
MANYRVQINPVLTAAACFGGAKKPRNASPSHGFVKDDGHILGLEPMAQAKGHHRLGRGSFLYEKMVEDHMLRLRRGFFISVLHPKNDGVNSKRGSIKTAMKEQEANSTKNRQQQQSDCHLGSEHERGSGAAGALRRPALDGVDGSDAADVGGAGIGVGSRSNGGVLVAAVLDPIPPVHVPHLLPYSPLNGIRVSLHQRLQMRRPPGSGFRDEAVVLEARRCDLREVKWGSEEEEGNKEEEAVAKWEKVVLVEEKEAKPRWRRVIDRTSKAELAFHETQDHAQRDDPYEEEFPVRNSSADLVLPVLLASGAVLIVHLQQRPRARLHSHQHSKRPRLTCRWTSIWHIKGRDSAMLGIAITKAKGRHNVPFFCCLKRLLRIT